MNEFQKVVRHPRFERENPRVLIIEQPYFLYREIKSALEQVGCDYRCVELPGSDMLEPEFIKHLLTSLAEFKPDFALTVNHFGLDRAGQLAGLLEEMHLPLASWFVDSPQLILHDYPSQSRKGISVFTYDAGSVAWLQSAGFEHVHFLPLGTDPNRFKPGGEPPSAWRARVSFVGDSMTSQVAEMGEAARVAPLFHFSLSELAYAFGESAEVLPMVFLKKCHPDMFAEVSALPSLEARLACEKALTFTAARQYRLRCVQGLMDYTPSLQAMRDGRPCWGDLAGGRLVGWTITATFHCFTARPRSTSIAPACR